MPQAVAAVPSILSFAVGTITVGQLITTILINVGLGALEYRDEAGELWVALDG